MIGPMRNLAMRAAQAGKDPGLLMVNAVNKTCVRSGLVRKAEGAIVRANQSCKKNKKLSVTSTEADS